MPYKIPRTGSTDVSVQDLLRTVESTKVLVEMDFIGPGRMPSDAPDGSDRFHNPKVAPIETFWGHLIAVAPIEQVTCPVAALGLGTPVYLDR